MPDLAFIHPLLVKNPLPTDALHASVRQVATAGAQLDTRLRALMPRERGMASLAAAWQATVRPALYGGIDDVAAFAERLRMALPPLCAAGPYAATDAQACSSVADGLQVLKLAAVAQAAGAAETTAALERLNRFGAADQQAGATAACFEALQAVQSAQRGMERAWYSVVCGFNALLGQLTGATLNSALMVARLEIAFAGWNELAAHLRAPSNAPRIARAPDPARQGGQDQRAPLLKTVSAFRDGGIGEGADAVAAVIALLDSLAAGIAQQRSPGPNSAPLVGRHVDAVRELARAWPERLRPAVLASMAALKHFGEQFVECEAPRLQAAFGRMRRQDLDERSQAAGLVLDVSARLALLAQGFDSVALGVGDYLSTMARASLDLETDTAEVSRRLQSGQSRAEALACLASRLRLRLGMPSAGAARPWLPAVFATLLAQARRSPTARLVGVAHELDRVRSAQAGTMHDAASLQSLLPALSSYLNAIDRLGAGVSAVLGGSATLQAQLADLHSALLANPASGAMASAQLRAALADWRSIARRIGRLPPQASVMMPGGVRPSLHG
ncbi:hypothetical protein [Massilia soli]|uniref:Uncharacterized protein n=1 Tax=Massilia soli TaxID=2792854 RepID=A0ABS7SU36_9BURK|nr:hypothetical protein [Massilia soli]MBZ2209451.1 hypothetical protein [Massilia soli]